MEANQTTAQPRVVFLKLPDVAARVCMCESAIYKRMAKGLFPKPVGLGAGTGKRWLEHEVEAWMLEQIAKRDAEGK